MERFIKITKAISDETRVRALAMLQDQELCLCQIIDALKLAPSTVSKHMTILHDAGLVLRRKQGKWQHYRLANTSPDCSTQIREALAWTFESLERSQPVVSDKQYLNTAKEKNLQEICACYRN